MFLTRRFVPALFLLALVPLVRAQAPLADRVPADAIIYVGWQGTDALQAQYQQSKTRALFDALNVQNLVDQIIRQATADAGDDAKKLADAQLFTTLCKEVHRYPVAVYFGGIDFTEDKPMPRLAMLVQAGKDNAARLATQLQASIDKNHKEDAPPVSARANRDFVLVTVGKPVGFDVVLAPGAPRRASLVASKDFLAALTQTDKSAPLVMYFQGEKLLKLVDEAIRTRNAGNRQLWTQLSDGMGIDAIKYGMLTGNFAGRDWQMQGFIALGEKRTGVVQLMDAKPLAPETLALIPKTAAFAGAVQFDGNRLLTDIRAAAVRANEKAQGQIDAVLQSITTMTGVNLQKDLLPSFGPEWLYYSAPDAAGKTMQSCTVINKLRDPLSAEKALGDMEIFLSALAAQRQRDELTFSTEKAGELTIHVIAWKLPGDNKGKLAWAIQNGAWFCGPTAKAVEAAVEHVARKAPGLDQHPGFSAARKQLGGEKFSCFAFANLPQIGPEGYALTCKMVEKRLKDAPKKIDFTMPPYEKIAPLMSPALATFWTDQDGWHMKSIEPFPGSNWCGGLELMLRSLAPENARPARKRGAELP